MAERYELLESIAAKIADYRNDDLDTPTPEHVQRWVRQFDTDVQVALLQELDHVLGNTYFSKKNVIEFLTGILTNEELTGKHPGQYWKQCHFLRIQQKGHSQAEMLDVFDNLLYEEHGFKSTQSGSDGGDYIYVDDVLFSGNRIGKDLDQWIQEDAPVDSRLHIVVIATHSFGEYKLQERVEKTATENDKNVTLNIWRVAVLENRLAYRNNSEVLWPAVLPEEQRLKQFLSEQKKFPFQPRTPTGSTNHKIFSSEQGRQLLEQQFLLAGMRIRSFSQDPAPLLRPLGFSPFGLGFGSTIVTFRNCPNNCPLALWWGDPNRSSNHPLSRWYPLFRRKTYDTPIDLNNQWITIDDIPENW